jgi:hypothetical protein
MIENLIYASALILLVLGVWLLLLSFKMWNANPNADGENRQAAKEFGAVDGRRKKWEVSSNRSPVLSTGLRAKKVGTETILFPCSRLTEESVRRALG